MNKIIDSNLQIKCNVDVIKENIVTGETRVENYHNKVVDVGLNEIRNFLIGTPTEFTHFALGTGTTAVANGDTSLETETYRDTLTNRASIDTGKMQYEYFLDSTSANGDVISEAGIFDASSGGNMLARVLLTAEEKTAEEAWTYVWTFTIARA